MNGCFTAKSCYSVKCVPRQIKPVCMLHSIRFRTHKVPGAHPVHLSCVRLPKCVAAVSCVTFYLTLQTLAPFPRPLNRRINAVKNSSSVSRTLGLGFVHIISSTQVRVGMSCGRSPRTGSHGQRLSSGCRLVGDFRWATLIPVVCVLSNTPSPTRRPHRRQRTVGVDGGSAFRVCDSLQNNDTIAICRS